MKRLCIFCNHSAFLLLVRSVSSCLSLLHCTAITCTNVNKFCILFTEYILMCCLTIFLKLYQLVYLCNVSCKVETELLSIIYMTFRLRRLTLKYTFPSTCWRRSDNPFFSPSYEMLYPSSGNDPTSSAAVCLIVLSEATCLLYTCRSTDYS
jgi:hypothetical protein